MQCGGVHKIQVEMRSQLGSGDGDVSHAQVFASPWTAACQDSRSITNSWSLLKLMSIESVMPSNHFILCHPLLLLPSILPSIGDAIQPSHSLSSPFPAFNLAWHQGLFQ